MDNPLFEFRVSIVVFFFREIVLTLSRTLWALEKNKVLSTDLFIVVELIRYDLYYE